MTQRKHVHSSEVQPVAEALREYLTEMVPLHEGETPLTGTEKAQFKVLYRFENCFDGGRPTYPEPYTWGRVAQYLDIMVPLHSIDSFRGELQPVESFDTSGLPLVEASQSKHTGQPEPQTSPNVNGALVHIPDMEAQD